MEGITLIFGVRRTAMKNILYLLFVMSLLLIGCSKQEDKEDGKNVPETHSGTRTVILPLKSEGEKTIFNKAVSSSTKLAGIVDVTNPQYQFELEDDLYFLWLNKESGQIMNNKDTHKVFTLSKESVKEINTFIQKHNRNSSLSDEEKPPVLRITIGKNNIKTSLGGYSWQYKEKKSGEVVNVMADSASPPEIERNDQAVKVDLKNEVKLNFDFEEPYQYEILVWDNKTVVATYKAFNEVKEKGYTVFEIKATWEQGQGSYAVALDVQ